MGNSKIISNFLTAFVSAQGWNYAFGARTGGARETHWIDDLSLTLFAPPVDRGAVANVFTNSSISVVAKPLDAVTSAEFLTSPSSNSFSSVGWAVWRPLKHVGGQYPRLYRWQPCLLG